MHRSAGHEDDKRASETEEAVATKAIVGEKVGMTQIWDDQHRAVPVTVVKRLPVASCR